MAVRPLPECGLSGCSPPGPVAAARRASSLPRVPLTPGALCLCAVSFAKSLLFRSAFPASPIRHLQSVERCFFSKLCKLLHATSCPVRRTATSHRKREGRTFANETAALTGLRRRLRSARPPPEQLLPIRPAASSAHDTSLGAWVACRGSADGSQSRGPHSNGCHGRQPRLVSRTSLRSSPASRLSPPVQQVSSLSWWLGRLPSPRSRPRLTSPHFRLPVRRAALPAPPTSPACRSSSRL